MTSVQQQPRTMPVNHRHHPYASSSSSSSRPAPQPQSSRKWTTTSSSVAPIRTRSPERSVAQALPSPPRSRRDDSEAPPAGLGAAFGGRDGGKWWDEELPQPPASLSSILDSFRRSGEGDRDLLLAILGAKKAEEERLTSLIQTRLTILQARLSVHAAAEHPASAESVYSPHASSSALMPERTPSLTSRASASSSAGPVSPAEPSASYLAYDPRETAGLGESYHLPPPTNLWRRTSSNSDSLPSIRMQTGYAKKSGEAMSPRSEPNGLEMLLDAGRRVETRVE